MVDRRAVRRHNAQQISLPATIAIFVAAFALTAWPWLSGHVTIPWDAKSQFFPQVQFLATSIAHGEWPWWTPHVFAGWPQISDPQSLLFSPLHVLLAALNPAISLRAFDAVVFAYLCLGGIGIILFFRDRGWHAGGGGGGGACVRARRRRQRTRAAYRPGHQPRLSAADPVAAGARAGALVVARGPRRGRTGWPDGDRPRPGGAAVPLCADRLRAGLLAHRQGHSRSRTGDAAAALGRGT